MKENVLQFIRTEGELNNGIYLKSSFNRNEGSLLTLTDTQALYHFHPARVNHFIKRKLMNFFIRDLCLIIITN